LHLHATFTKNKEWCNKGVNMKRIACAVTGAFCLSLANSHAVAANYTSEEGLWSYDENIFVPSQQDPEDPSNANLIELPANIFVPATSTPGQTFPAVIFINSWTLNEHEYAPVAQELADRGYVVLRYTTRGFWNSPEFIDTSGNKDVADASNAISYLIDNYPVNPAKIALAGTSYGSGISLNTAMQDTRVAAVVATSTWASMKESLWPNQTPKDDWIKLLLGSSKRPIGRQDPEIAENYENLTEHKNVQATIDWALERSAISYIDMANQRPTKPAIYVTNNLHDYLFHPTSIVNFLSQYQGPWHIDFNFGVHGAGEAEGLSGDPTESFVWNNAFAWLDHYLKGTQNYIDVVDKVTTRVKSTQGGMRDSFATFPVDDAVIRLYADPEVGTQGGSLNDVGTFNADSPIFDSEYDVVWTGGVAGAQLMSGHFYDLDRIDPQGALVYKTPVLAENIYLRGSSRLTFSAYVQHNIQYFGYLMDYDPATGRAHWIGHGPFSWHKEEGSDYVPTEPVEITIDMFWTAHDIAAGHQLLLVIDGEDGEYFTYADSPKEHQLVIDSAHPITVDIPVIYDRKVVDTIERRAALAEQEQAEEDDDNSRGANGDGGSYGPGGGSIDPATLLMMLGFAGALRRRIGTNASSHQPQRS
jgi:predicted acyl esterase